MYVGMRLVAVGTEIQGKVRAVYDDGDGDGEYIVISGENVYLTNFDDE